MAFLKLVKGYVGATPMKENEVALRKYSIGFGMKKGEDFLDIFIDEKSGKVAFSFIKTTTGYKIRETKNGCFVTKPAFISWKEGLYQIRKAKENFWIVDNCEPKVDSRANLLEGGSPSK